MHAPSYVWLCPVVGTVHEMASGVFLLVAVLVADREYGQWKAVFVIAVEVHQDRMIEENNQSYSDKCHKRHDHRQHEKYPCPSGKNANGLFLTYSQINNHKQN